MNKYNRLVLYVLTFAIIQGCASNSYEIAELRHGWKTNYVLFVSGDRRLMVHDPISAIFGKSRVSTQHIHVKKLSQKLSAQEIIVTSSEGEVTGLSGYVYIDNKKASIELTQYGKPYLFNGQYRVTIVDNKN
ncbi:hypothetical protein [Alkalimarinus sediminis]|uniref:Uncharacterized protein n=1 Tax=Alkalimarinus sediminis TaxID=1632866 RepID=A0A9E8HL69_9ALTE|nr:hypothetical protein [Alkalimarinus sediminis]UZW76360.1 hypothetical protein NNL22_07175 [Alkalimarinus sediminis]